MLSRYPGDGGPRPPGGRSAEAAAAGGLGGLEAALREHGGRPHWGKVHAAPDARLAAELPGWASFSALASD